MFIIIGKVFTEEASMLIVLIDVDFYNNAVVMVNQIQVYFIIVGPQNTVQQ